MQELKQCLVCLEAGLDALRQKPEAAELKTQLEALMALTRDALHQLEQLNSEPQT